MSMERFKSVKEMLMAQIEGQMSHLYDVDAKELGEVIDMVKDLEEAMYYCTITEAMKKKEEQPQYNNINYYTEPYYDKMYYGGNGNGGQSNSGGMSYRDGGGTGYHDGWSGQMRDSREGRSGPTRRMYMEHKSLHADKTTKMKDLEKYMQELTHDMTEMIEDASPEEKQLLQQKISTLAQKIV